MVDIVLTVYNNPELTEKCLASINACAAKDQRLIIVDNGSGSETAGLLGSASQRYKSIPIEVMRLDSNQGFIKAANAGLRASQGEFVCLLSNDTIVTFGWLVEMCAIMEADQRIGIVSPNSNTYGLSPRAGETVDELAKRLRGERGKYVETAACVGFCLCLRRKVLAAIGHLDEAFGMGYFEDTDFCRRAQKAGFINVIAQAAYVWHREHSTFQSAERDALFALNRGLFESRWGKPQRVICLRGKRDADEFKQRCLGLARQGNWVWAIEAKTNASTAFNHAQIKQVLVAPGWERLYAAWLWLVKRKKPIDKIYF